MTALPDLDLGKRIRRARKQRDLTLAQVAQESGCSESAMSRYERGEHPVPDTVLAAVAQVLDMPVNRADSHQDQCDVEMDRTGDPVAALTRLGEADMQRRSLIVTAAYSTAAALLPLGSAHATEIAHRAHRAKRGGAVTRAEINDVEAMTAALTRVDERHGGQHGRSAARSYLVHDVLPLCDGRFTNAADRADMHSATTNLVMLVAWKAFDAGEERLAQTYYAQAARLTQEVRRPGHEALVLRQSGHLSMHMGRPRDAMRLIDAAMDRGSRAVDPATRSLMVMSQARAYAHAGARTAALRHIGRAYDLALAADDRDRMTHAPQMWGQTLATIHSHTAKAHLALGNPAAAEKAYQLSTEARDPADYPRIHGMALLWLSRSYLAQRNVDAACSIAQRGLDLLDNGMRSKRALDQVTELRRALASYTHVREAADVAARGAEWVRAR